MDIGILRHDQAKVEDGVWFDYHDGARVLVASINSPGFRRERDRLMRPYRQQELRGTLPEARQTEILCRCMARHMLLGWEEFTADGAALPYSQEAAYELLVAAPVFRDDIAMLAAEHEAFREEQRESAEKN